MSEGHAGARPASPVRASADMRGLGAAGFAVILVFFGGFGTWAAVAPLDGAAVAPGAVGIEGRRKSVQDRGGVVVRELLVAEGDEVAANQVLVRLDRTETRAALGVLTARRDALKALEARLAAERDRLDRPAFAAKLLGSCSATGTPQLPTSSAPPATRWPSSNRAWRRPGPCSPGPSCGHPRPAGSWASPSSPSAA